MTKHTDEQSDGPLTRILRVAFWFGTGALLLALVVIVPVSIDLQAISSSSQVTLRETILMIACLLIFTILFWGLVYWSEKSGVARWNEDEREQVESGLDEWNDRDD